MKILGNPLADWALAVGLAFVVFTVLSVAKYLLARKLSAVGALAKLRLDTALAAMVRKTRVTFLYIVAVYSGSLMVTLHPHAHRVIAGVTFVALLFQILIWGIALISFWVEQEIRSVEGDGARQQTLKAIGFLARLAFVAVVVLWGLDNFGVNITTLVAGLGVGGVAIALAVQNILGDLFASLTIVLDRPFVYGDYITVDEYKGTVENVGLKTTRIRSESGEELIFPNAALLQSRIRNYKRMQQRRIVFRVGVAYDTKLELLKTIPAEFSRIIKTQKNVRFDRAHLVDLAKSTIDFEVVYWMLTPDYHTYMETHQAINLAILESFAEKKIELAYDTHTVFTKTVST